MQLISLDILRTLGLPNVRPIKPEHFLAHKDELRAADWVLFPEYWQLNALAYGLKCRIFPSLPSYYIGHDKVEMTRAFQTVAPDNVPLIRIAANGPLEREEIWDTFPHPFVAKNPKASMGEGVWLIESRSDWQRYCDQATVLYAQEYLPIDRDLRIVIVGDQVVSAYWRHQADTGFYNNISRGGRMVAGPVPDSAFQLALRVATTLGIDHAGFDIAMVGGHPYLLEFNRLFGNQGVDNGRLNTAILEYLRGHNQPDRPDPAGVHWPLAV